MATFEYAYHCDAKAIVPKKVEIAMGVRASKDLTENNGRIFIGPGTVNWNMTVRNPETDSEAGTKYASVLTEGEKAAVRDELVPFIQALSEYGHHFTAFIDTWHKEEIEITVKVTSDENCKSNADSIIDEIMELIMSTEIIDRYRDPNKCNCALLCFHHYRNTYCLY